jgi:hypothetical protein
MSNSRGGAKGEAPPSHPFIAGGPQAARAVTARQAASRQAGLDFGACASGAWRWMSFKEEGALSEFSTAESIQSFNQSRLDVFRAAAEQHARARERREA